MYHVLSFNMNGHALTNWYHCDRSILITFLKFKGKGRENRKQIIGRKEKTGKVEKRKEEGKRQYVAERGSGKEKYCVWCEE